MASSMVCGKLQLPYSYLLTLKACDLDSDLLCKKKHAKQFSRLLLFLENSEREFVVAIFLHFQILHICIRTWSISQREEKKKPSWSMLDRSLPPLRICSFWGSFSKIMFLFGALSLILTVHSSYAPPSLTCSAIFKHKKNKLRKMYKGRDCCWQVVKITVSGERIGGFKSRSLEKP